MNTNVFDYFVTQLGAAPDAELRDMPLDSVCGNDCRVAIDNAQALIACLHRAVGKDHPQHEINIIEATRLTVQVFAFG